MKHPHSFLMVSLLLLCCTQTITFAQSTASLTIPESLRGYWQFKTDNVSDWNGPLIGENFVENFYTVFYVEQMEQEADGSYFFHLRNQKGDTTEFRITPVFNDTAILWYKGCQIDFKFEDDVHDAEKSVNAYNTLKDWGMQMLMGTVMQAARLSARIFFEVFIVNPLFLRRWDFLPHSITTVHASGVILYAKSWIGAVKYITDCTDFTYTTLITPIFYNFLP